MTTVALGNDPQAEPARLVAALATTGRHPSNIVWLAHGFSTATRVPLCHCRLA